MLGTRPAAATKPTLVLAAYASAHKAPFSSSHRRAPPLKPPTFLSPNTLSRTSSPPQLSFPRAREVHSSQGPMARPLAHIPPSVLHAGANKKACLQTHLRARHAGLSPSPEHSPFTNRGKCSFYFPSGGSRALPAPSNCPAPHQSVLGQLLSPI